MIPTFQKIDGLDIAIYDSRTNGQPVVFIHGNSLSSESFRYQFESELAEKYRLIAFDLPGHGQSSPAKNPSSDYSGPGFQKFLMAVIGELNLLNAVFVGHSLGGHLLLDASPKLEELCKAMLIFGAPPFQGVNHPFERSHFPHPDLMLAYSGNLSDDQYITLGKIYIQKGARVPEAITKDLRRTDNEMRPNLGANSTPDKLPDEVGIISGMKCPLAIFHGAQDQLLQTGYLSDLNIPTLWKGQVHLINSGHCPQIENPQEFNQLLAEFIDDVVL